MATAPDLPGCEVCGQPADPGILGWDICRRCYRDHTESTVSGAALAAAAARGEHVPTTAHREGAADADPDTMRRLISGR